MRRQIAQLSLGALSLGAGVGGTLFACDFGIDVDGLTGGDGASDVVTGGDAGDADALGIVPAVQIGAGGAHSCAVRDDGSAVCWGAETADGRLGDGKNLDSSLPVLVTFLSDATSIATGSTHSCAGRR